MPSPSSKLKTIALCLSVALFLSGRASAVVGDVKPESDSNAALKYWQAFALLPTLNPSQEKLVQEWSKVPLDAAALQLIEQSQGSREYLLRGAKLDRCNWSLDYDDGFFLRLPYLSKSLLLARLAALHARHEFSQGHWESGWADVSAIQKLARQVEAEPIMIVQLVSYAIEATAFDAAAPYLPELKSALPQNAPTALASLPAEPTIPQLLLKEKQVGPLWLLERLKAAEQRQPGAWQTVWKETFDAALGGNEGEAAADRDAIKSVKSFAQATKWLDELLPLYDELIKLAALPWHEFDARYPDFVKQAKLTNPLAAVFYPNLDKFLDSQRRHQARTALFQAAISIVQGGPDKVGDIKDPFGNGPFEYRALDKGFELKSKLLVKGQRLTLTVGTAK
jgi:hypothetical protein